MKQSAGRRDDRKNEGEGEEEEEEREGEMAEVEVEKEDLVSLSKKADLCSREARRELPTANT